MQTDSFKNVSPTIGNAVLPAVLRLTLKKKWYDMILSGEKKEEYREVKRYWIQRLCNEVEYEMGGTWEGVFKKFNQVEFKNGYGKDAPTMLVEFKGLRIGEAKPEWSDNWKGEVFVISVGAVLHSR
jgi:hypothetical protein